MCGEFSHLWLVVRGEFFYVRLRADLNVFSSTWMRDIEKENGYKKNRHPLFEDAGDEAYAKSRLKWARNFTRRSRKIPHEQGNDAQKSDYCPKLLKTIF